jgi:hypothetical protein
MLQLNRLKGVKSDISMIYNLEDHLKVHKKKDIPQEIKFVEKNLMRKSNSVP